MKKRLHVLTGAIVVVVNILVWGFPQAAQQAPPDACTAASRRAPAGNTRNRERPGHVSNPLFGLPQQPRTGRADGGCDS